MWKFVLRFENWKVINLSFFYIDRNLKEFIYIIVDRRKSKRERVI